MINDRHRCRGRLARPLAWAALWATAYTGPMAAAAWFVHFVHQQRQRGV